MWELRHNIGAYDAAYIALAEALGCELLTGDVKLKNAAGAAFPLGPGTRPSRSLHDIRASSRLPANKITRRYRCYAFRHAPDDTGGERPLLARPFGVSPVLMLAPGCSSWRLQVGA
jgi:hypothetical protein